MNSLITFLRLLLLQLNNEEHYSDSWIQIVSLQHVFGLQFTSVFVIEVVVEESEMAYIYVRSSAKRNIIAEQTVSS